jgi:hypothetical protein
MKVDGRISIDYLRLTLVGDAIKVMKTYHENLRGVRLSGAKGYRCVEKFGTGWVRRSDPWKPTKDGSIHESWEVPGFVAESEIGWLKEKYGHSPMDQVKCTLIHLAFDVVGQNYPRPFDLRALFQELDPSARTEWGRIIEGDLGEQTWYLGSKYSDVELRTYEKGKKFLSEKIKADKDWVRVELIIKRERAHAAFLHVLLGRQSSIFKSYLFDLFGPRICRDYFPVGQILKLEAPHRERNSIIGRTVSMLQQAGPKLKAFIDLQIMDELMGMPLKSGYQDTVRVQVIDEIMEVGLDEFVKQVREMYFFS